MRECPPRISVWTVPKESDIWVRRFRILPARALRSSLILAMRTGEITLGRFFFLLAEDGDSAGEKDKQCEPNERTRHDLTVYFKLSRGDLSRKRVSED